MEQSCYTTRVIRDSLFDQQTFEQRPKGSEGMSLANLKKEHFGQRETANAEALGWECVSVFEEQQECQQH